MVHRLTDSIIEKRVTDIGEGVHRVELLINEKEFEDLYDDLDMEAASDMIRIYLDTKADDGRPENISYNWEKGKHIVSVTADLRYTGNSHTEFINRHRD